MHYFDMGKYLVTRLQRTNGVMRTKKKRKEKENKERKENQQDNYLEEGPKKILNELRMVKVGHLVYHLRDGKFIS